MSLVKTMATAGRVLTQLRHDPRTLAMLFVVPPVLLTLLKYVFNGNQVVFDNLAPMLLGIFPMILMFLVTSIATLRERRSGTLARLMTMPMGKLDFILGYALAFSLVAFVQACITSFVMLGLLNVTVLGGTLATLVGALAAAFLGTSLGLFVSAFASSEFQAVQFMPAFLFPQLLTCGLFVPRDQMARVLQWFADVMPLTYSVDAMKQVTAHSDWTPTHTKDLLIIIVYALAALALGSITIRRQQKS
ncbi:MAG TPA: ABC transporter permease [Candidatus Saccharimonadales bacterium]|jgi:ABC-2 type transport system permease protein|nr:ABC transporter permease [Candidatus Saccharimonadales bacterium]